MSKPIILYLYNGTALGNKKGWTVDLNNKIDEYLNDYTEFLEARPLPLQKKKKRVSAAWLHLYKILENTN